MVFLTRRVSAAIPCALDFSHIKTEKSEDIAYCTRHGTTHRNVDADKQTQTHRHADTDTDTDAQTHRSIGA